MTAQVNNDKPILKLVNKKGVHTLSKNTKNDIIQVDAEKLDQNDKTKVVTASANQIKSQTQKSKKSKLNRFLSIEQYQEILALMQNTYPKCFSNPPTPLKIGIHSELSELCKDKFSSTTLRRFLAQYCRTKPYKQAHILGANRIDLSGNIVDMITAKQIQGFKAKTKQSQAKTDSIDKSNDK